MAINITKQSGVIAFTQDSNQPKYYFGERGSFTVLGDNETIQIQIGGTNYQIVYTNLKVNGQIPATITTAKTLLNSIFGT